MSRQVPVNFYKLLGVATEATPEEITKAYKQLALQWHPDKNPDNQEEAQKKFLEIGEAYKILSDPEQRTRYNESLGIKSRPANLESILTSALNFLNSEANRGRPIFHDFNKLLTFLEKQGMTKQDSFNEILFSAAQFHGVNLLNSIFSLSLFSTGLALTQLRGENLLGATLREAIRFDGAKNLTPDKDRMDVAKFLIEKGAKIDDCTIASIKKLVENGKITEDDCEKAISEFRKFEGKTLTEERAPDSRAEGPSSKRLALDLEVEKNP